jgi:hypothetical protein
MANVRRVIISPDSAIPLPVQSPLFEFLLKKLKPER